MKSNASIAVAMFAIAAFTAVPTSYANDRYKAVKASVQIPPKPEGIEQDYWETLYVMCVTGWRSAAVRPELRPMMEETRQKKCAKWNIPYNKTLRYE